MKTIWYKWADSEADKKDIKDRFDACLDTRKLLARIIETKLSSEDSSNLSKEGYDSPNWAYKQADLVGYKRAMKEILSLLDLN